MLKVIEYYKERPNNGFVHHDGFIHHADFKTYKEANDYCKTFLKDREEKADLNKDKTKPMILKIVEVVGKVELDTPVIKFKEEKYK